MGMPGETSSQAVDQDTSDAVDYVLSGSNRMVDPYHLSIDDWVRIIRRMTYRMTQSQKNFILSPDRAKPISKLVGYNCEIAFPAGLTSDTRAMHIGNVGGERINERGFKEHWHLLLIGRGLLLGVHQSDERKYPVVKDRTVTFRLINTDKALAEVLRFQEQFRTALPPTHVGPVILRFLENLLGEAVNQKQEQLKSLERAREEVRGALSRLK